MTVDRIGQGPAWDLRNLPEPAWRRSWPLGGRRLGVSGAGPDQRNSGQRLAQTLRTRMCDGNPE